jgi:flagellar biosynthesis protein FlhB
MSEDDSTVEKEFDPTETKLAEQRRKGEVPRSTDLNTAAAFLGLLIAGTAMGAATLTQLGTLGAVILGQADHLAPLLTERATPPMGGILAKVAMATLPLFAVPFVLVIGSVMLQRALIFAPEKVQPKLSRISLIGNAKQKFGREGLFEFGKSTLKLVIITALLWAFLVRNLDLILGSMTLTAAIASVEMLQLLLRFLTLVVVVWLALGAIDYLWQRAQHFRRNRMSHQDLRDELKQAEGDPHAKGERRRRGREIASNRMLENVAEASVIIVNPTHYAVALKWSPQSAGAPVCVAKGVDDIAARIRERATAAGVPIHSDPVTARALYASVKLEAEVRPEHYAAVAAAIRFAETMRARTAKGRWA